MRHQFLSKPRKRRNKFNAVKASHDGYKFDSIKECNVYKEYAIELSLGYIKDLKVHPKYPIVINGIKVCNVLLDFEYFDNRINKIKFIDVKAFDMKTRKYLVTPASILKRKLIEAEYGIKVEYV